MSLADDLKRMQRLRELAEDDAEGPHKEADSLIADLLDELADGHPTVKKIVAVYRDMEKWYA